MLLGVLWPATRPRRFSPYEVGQAVSGRSALPYGLCLAALGGGVDGGLSVAV